MILACNNIDKAFGTKEILKQVSFHVEDHEKTAIVGINGAGKSTLLKIIMNQMSADHGEVILSKGATIGYLAQHEAVSSDNTIYEELLDAKKDIILMEQKIHELEESMKYEEGEKYTKESLKPLIDKVYSKINELLSNSKNGKIIKDGISVALVGKPNVGKSSILNALLEEEKAIVTNIPGTTRDIVEGKINLDGIILNIIDTAGIRKTNDIVEQIGVEKSLKMIGEADLIIYVLNNNEELTSEDLETINELQSKQSIIFINKNDLDNKIDLRRLSNYNIITGNTLNRLINLNEIEQEDYTYLSNARQIALITKAKDMIENIYNNYENVPIDMFTIDLKNTYETLGEIIGETYKDDLLDELFSKFCLGK